MRLFVALEVPSTVREKLAKLIGTLQAVDPGPRWVSAGNLHVTLKFVGRVPEAQLGPMRAQLAGVKSDSAVELSFRGLGVFPAPGRPRVLWAGIEASPNLRELANSIEQSLEPLGIAREARDFSPHLTLARLEPSGLSDRLRGAMASEGPKGFGSFRSKQFVLVESRLKPAGADYTALQSFAFAAEA